MKRNATIISFLLLIVAIIGVFSPVVFADAPLVEMRGGIIPPSGGTSDLGSLDRPWRSLYLSSKTLYIDGVPASLNGTAGSPGVSITWLGIFSSPPSSPTLDNAYRNSTDNKSYVWDGASWNIMTQDGQQGSQGSQGIQGIQGNNGTQGNPGPNQVTTATTTDITGLLKGNGSTVLQAIGGSDYDTIHSNRTVLDNIQEAFTTALKTSYDWLATNFTEAWKNQVDSFMSSTINGHAVSSNYSVTKTDVGLGNVDDTSDVNKPVSTAVQSALDAKGTSNVTLPINTGDVTNLDTILSGKQATLGFSPADNATTIASLATKAAINQAIDSFGAASDNTGLNASTSAHGLLPKLANDANKFLNGLGQWAVATAMITYNDVITALGFTPVSVNSSATTGNAFVVTANTTSGNAVLIQADKLTYGVALRVTSGSKGGGDLILVQANDAYTGDAVAISGGNMTGRGLYVGGGGVDSNPQVRIERGNRTGAVLEIAGGASSNSLIDAIGAYSGEFKVNKNGSIVAGSYNGTPIGNNYISSAATWNAKANSNQALDSFGATSDNTGLNASTTAHGLLKKLSGVATEILNGAGNFITLTKSMITTALGFTPPNENNTVNGYTLSTNITLTADNVSAIAKSIGTTKGDIIGFTGSAAPARFGVGTNNQTLVADNTTATGLKWATPTGGGSVTSVFGRIGDVIATTGDYTWAQITKTVSSLADIANRSHNLLTDIGSNNHTVIDNFIVSKGVPSGLAPLDSANKTPTINLGGVGASGSNYLRGDQTWATPAGGSSSPWYGKIAVAMADGNPGVALREMQSAGNVAATPTVITISIARCSGFILPADLTVNTIRWYGVGATTAVYHIAIYRYSDKVRLTGDLNPNTTLSAWNSVAVSPAVTLLANTLYFIAVSIDTTGTTPGICCIGATIAATTGQIQTAPQDLPGNLDFDAGFIDGYFFQFAVTNGLLPTPANTLAKISVLTGGMPAIFLDNSSS